MKKELEELLNRELKEQKEKGNINSDECKITEVKIADIVFAYNNS